MSNATVGSVLLYLNGVRVPCTSVSVSYADGTPASGGAQIPWHPILEGLGEEDLIQVAVFYLDTVYYDKPQYCLLFEGRLSGYSYSNTNTAESMSLQFESNLMVLNDMSINFTTKATKSGSTADKDYPNQLNVKGRGASLLTSKFSGRSIKRPFDIIENVIYAATGTFRDKNKYTDNIDDSSFLAEVSRLEEALNEDFEGELSRLREDPTKSNLSDEELSGLALESAFEGIAEQALEMGVPADRYFSSGGDIRGKARLAAAALINRKVKSSAVNYRDVVMSGFFARHMRLIRFREHWMCSPYLEGFPGDGSEEPSLGGGVFPMLRSKGAKKFFKAMLRRTGEKMGPQGRVFSLVSNLFSLMFYRIQEVPAPPAYISSKYSLPDKQLKSILEDLEDGEQPNYSDLYEKAYASGGHVTIGSYLTAPIAPYAIPPSCNVIFPCQRSSLTLTNSTNSPPTRVYYNRRNQLGKLNLASKSPGHNYDASRVGFPSISAGLSQKAAGGSSRDLEALVFPEEYYRGPRVKMSYAHPSYSSIQDFANSARFSESKLSAGKSVTVFDTDPESVNFSLEAVEKSASKGISSYGLYFMLAQKEYQDARTASRGGSVSTVFNPYVIPGFPCAVLSSDDSGMQYYGKIASVTHTLSNQGAATTSMSLSNIRDIKDNLKQVIIDRAITDISPSDPIKEIRSLLQLSAGAEEYYRSLLKRGEESAEVLPEDLIGLNQRSEQVYLELQEAIERERAYVVGALTFKDLEGKEYTYAGRQEGIDSLNSSLEDPSTTTEEIEEVNLLLSIATSFIREREDSIEEKAALQAELDRLESLQVNSEHEYYSGSLYPSSFDVKDFLGWKTETSSEPRRINILHTDPRPEETDPVWGVPEYSKLVPLLETRSYFKEVDKALKYNSRPVCTLEEYIHFYAVADRSPGSDEVGRGRGVRGRKRTHSCGAVYYDIIRSFVSGPGLQPGSTVDGNVYYSQNTDKFSGYGDLASDIQDSDFRMSPKVPPIPPQGALTYIDYNGNIKEFYRFKKGATVTLDDLPDSRKDWQKLLLDYLSVIESSATSREG
jgi:hypothetical protein